ncbi:hypothetical protein Q6D67_20890 [Haliea sp. E1-2-M8]|uniref:hypothetical protein n=1 Tax=Haliea sp. E1-2-M8 TaxID=3064706 RepID=UPI00271976CE|nr:hypothetical protein [Haliea sp. E1-2-M8]MDO8864147.1 hypothetical protein [Haliea sp. E1-2-M8]
MALKKDEYTVLPNKARLYKQSGSTRFYVAIKLDNGKWERKATGTDDLEEARERATGLYWEAKALAAHNLPQASRTFGSVAKSVVDELEAKRDTPQWKQTYQHYIGAIHRYQIPYFGRYKLDNVGDHYLGYNDFVAEQIGRTPSASTMNTHNAALKLIFDKAIRLGYMTTLNSPKLIHAGTQSQRRATFELSEFKSLINALKLWCNTPTHRQYDTEIRKLLYEYVLFLSNTGIRHGEEAMRIRWHNVSIKESLSGEKLVVLSVLKKKGRKGTAQYRDVVVRERYGNAMAVITRIKDSQNALKAIPIEDLIRGRYDLPLFAISDGTQPKRMDGTFKKFLTDMNMLVGSEGTHRTRYSWRHYYATTELTRKDPISIALLAKQMGTSIKMIEQHYGHLDVVKHGDALRGRTDW